MRPEARSDEVLVQEVGDEVVVYDPESDRAHRLNPTAALVWRHADGRTPVTEIAALLHRRLRVPADAGLVWLALERLQEAGLLRGPVERPAGISRRQALRRLAVAGGVAALLPVVTSITAPTPAMAQTPVPGRCTCNAMAVTPAEPCNPGDVAMSPQRGFCVPGSNPACGNRPCTVTFTFNCQSDGTWRLAPVNNAC